ncbi:MAG: NusG domain II-containing protein [Clostridia bacterium]|nr:NusG domain II-containing protein [Clostridia bacterium]
MKLKPFDLMAVIAVAVLAFVFALPILMQNGGASLEITTDTKTYTLPLDSERTHTVSSNSHTLILEIKDGSARVISHSCPDGVCAAMGAISSENQTIVCLPAKTVIRVTNADGEVLDGIAG